MNIQTEHLEDHTARFTVEIEPERLEKAKKQAARQIARQVNIPGFRKGKAPYNIIVQRFGEAALLQDAIEDLSQKIYRETLENQTDIEPYGPGSFEDFKLEDKPTFIYTVPLRPTVELNDYREVRVPYEESLVDDEMVDVAMKRIQEQEALVEESQQPVALGNRVTVNIHSEFADDPPEVEAASAEAGEEGADEDEGEDAEVDDRVPEKGDHFIHEHDAALNLDLEEDVILPGFKEALVGANVGDDVVFELDVPEDDDDYEDIRGRKIEFTVTINKIENVTLPELNDDLAARITEDEDEPLTLLQLRMRVRENLQNEMDRRTRSDYSQQALDKMVEQADVAFPEAMLQDQMDGMVEEFEGRLRQQGMDLDTYTRVMGQSREELREQYREPAAQTIRRSLVLTEIARAEEVTVNDEVIDTRIDEMLSQFGEQAEAMRAVFDSPQMRANMAQDVLNEMVFDRVIAIARGEAEVKAETTDETDAESGEVVASAEGETAEAGVEAETGEPVSETDDTVSDETNGEDTGEAADDEEAASDKD